MKKFLVLLFLTYSIISFSQNIPITKIKGLPFIKETAGSIYEVNNNSFFVVTLKECNISFLTYESIVYNIDSNCNIIDSLELLNYHKNGKYYYITDLFKFNNKIIGSGWLTDSITQEIQVWISELSENLTIIKDTALSKKYNYSGLFTAKLLPTSDNKLLVANFWLPDSTTFANDSTNTLLYLLDTNYCVTKQNSVYTHYGFNYVSVIEMLSNQTYHIITQDDITIINKNDLSLKNVAWHSSNGVSFGGSGAKSINDSLYMVPGFYCFVNINDQSGVKSKLIIRNMNGIKKDSIIIGNSLKQFDETSLNSYIFFNTDTLFAAGNNYSLDSDFVSYEDNTIFLWNIKLNGNVNWQKYYGIGKKFILTNIEKTSDGGCIMVGDVWDWHNSPFQYTTDMFFLKVDRNGNITGTSGIKENIKHSEILVYPNPAKDIINFEMGMYEGYKLTIINSMGQTITQQDVSSGKNSIDIHSFTKGIYLYSLVNNKGKVINGKFVKE